jgi:hypothetical protein
MADSTTVHIAENSAEEVALKLLTFVARAEGRPLPGVSGSSSTADRRYILDTYAECLEAVKGHRVLPDR